VARKCIVIASILGPSPDSPPLITELGEFHAVWQDGVSIGSDPLCTIVLPELAPVAVRVVGASNHKLLFRLPEGASLPLPPATRPIGRYDQRVDNGEFQVGPYRIRFGESYRDEGEPA
jgi:hypothetical protein